MDPPPPLSLSNLTRRFGARVALDDVSLSVEPGRIVGLVGPNGSGKTTLLKLVAGLLEPSGGTVRVFGDDPLTDPARVMQRVRFAFAPPALFDRLTAREHVAHLAALHRSGGNPVEAWQIDEALAWVGLVDRADDPVGSFSFGMRQRLALAQALVPRPEFLVLDEPTDGLDPLAVLELRAVLERLRADYGTAVLLSSHLLIEIENLVDSLMVLDAGRALFAGAPHELTDGERRLHLGVSDVGRARAVLAGRGIQTFGQVQRAREVSSGKSGVIVVEPGAASLEEAQGWMNDAGVSLESYHAHRPTLEQALLRRLQEAAE